MQMRCPGRKKKILFLIESLSGGGAEKVLVTTIDNIDRDRFDIYLCCVSNVGKYLDAVKDKVKYSYILPDASSLSGIRRILYKAKYKAMYSFLPPGWIYRLFVPGGCDIEAAFIEGNPTRIISASTNRRSRKLAWVHTDMRRFHKEDVSKETRMYNAFDTVVAVSDSVKDAFQQEFPDVRTEVVTLYNPIDSEGIVRLSQDGRDVPPRIRGVTRLVSVGRLVPVKGYDRLVRIVSRLNAEGYRVELWLIGDGGHKWYLQHLVSDIHAESQVRFWGEQANPYRFMSQSDLFVCSSLAEGYSSAVSEALILGLPVVTTACAGMDELLSGGGGIITDNDDEALYRGIKSLLDDKTLLDGLRVEAKERMHGFRLDERVRLIEEILDV